MNVFSRVGQLPYFRTKGLAEQSIFGHVPNATVLRPSLVFGPGDGFFAVCPPASSPLRDVLTY